MPLLGRVPWGRCAQRACEPGPSHDLCDSTACLGARPSGRAAVIFSPRFVACSAAGLGLRVSQLQGPSPGRVGTPSGQEALGRGVCYASTMLSWAFRSARMIVMQHQQAQTFRELLVAVLLPRAPVSAPLGAEPPAPPASPGSRLGPSWGLSCSGRFCSWVPSCLQGLPTPWAHPVALGQAL